MYSTCLFCAAPLGANDVLEHFPVGRRVAFDAHKGRLWAVCFACTQWNLAPLEERWEAVEACERLFRGTRLHTSTDNVGLARLRSGLELVRIGQPLRPELAAWRYGPRLARRRLTHLAMAGLGSVVGGAVIFGGLLAGPLAAFGAGWVWSSVKGSRGARIVAQAHTDAGVPMTIRVADLPLARVVRSDDFAEGWALQIDDPEISLELGGSEALRVAGLVLAALNARGATQGELRAAAERLDRAGSPAAAFIEAAGTRSWTDGLPLWTLLGEESLALEMSTHDETERRAMEGELLALERAWREAEEIAAIADSLLLPQSVHQMLARLGGGPRG